MNDVIAPGDRVEVMRPTGLFVLRATDVPIVAFAGGSGITPVMSIVKTALSTTTRSITLVYANRSVDSVIFADDLERLQAASGGRLTVHHHLDSELGFLDAEQCAALVGVPRARRTSTSVVPVPTWTWSRPVSQRSASTLRRCSSSGSRRPRSRSTTPHPRERATTESLVVRLDRRKHTLGYEAGDTILQAARRGGLQPPFSCEAGNCATCMAHLDEGTATMRVNNALSAEEVDDGWVLTCQAIPTSAAVVVNYEG